MLRVAGWTAIIWIVGALALPGVYAADVSVRATLRPLRAQVGESLTLSIEFSGVQDAGAPTLPAIQGFDVQYRGPSTQVSFINGQMSASVQHRYSLLPLQAGRYTIGPFTVDYQGKHYSTSSFNVEIVAAGQNAQGQGQPQGQGFRLALSVPRQEVYLNERIPVDLNLYVGAVRAELQSLPTLTADGFAIDRFEDPTQHQETIDGQTFQVVHFQSTLMPLRSGALTIGPAAVTLSVVERRRGGGGFFDDPFFAERRPVTLRSDPVVLNVLPLPEEGKPPGFAGAVGSYALDVTAAPVELNAGDPVTLTMTVRGSGNLPDSAAPMLSSTQGFRTYEPHVLKTEGDAKVYEQVLIPNGTEVRAVPPVRFSFFDPQKRAYQVAQSAPIALSVRAAQQPQKAEVVTTESKPTKPEELGRDIVYIKDDPGTLRPIDSPLPLLLWVLLPLPLALFAAAVWYDRQRTRLTGDERYARFTRAGRSARTGLAAAEQALARQERPAFYDAVFRTLQDYLAAKLDLPPGAIDADAAAARGAPHEVVELIRNVLTTCEHARFAPVGSAADLAATLRSAQEVVKRLERQRRRVALPSAAALIALCASAAAVRAEAPASPQTTFFHANALYKDGQYAAAAAEYEDILAHGLGSGNLYFNLGNAYFKAGNKGKAILNYERAHEISPADPDVEANAAYARSLTGAAACVPSLWQRAAFPLAGMFSTAALTLVAFTLYAVCFLSLALHRRLVRHPRILVYVAWISGLLSLVTATSLAWQASIAAADRAVVVASGDTAARFEPAANGTEHYALKEGSLVTVTDEREGWLQVRRCDGRRGWVSAKALERLNPPSLP